jgi:hypothetical protein
MGWDLVTGRDNQAHGLECVRLHDRGRARDLKIGPERPKVDNFS